MNEMKRLRNRWKHMRERCNNPKRKDYRYYGGQGIKVCKEWDSFNVFLQWWHQAAKRVKWLNHEVDVYSLEIDRMSSLGNYCPSNCRLVTHRENVIRVIRRNKHGRFISHAR